MDDLDLTHEQKIFLLRLVGSIGPKDQSIEDKIKQIEDEAFEEFILGSKDGLPDTVCDKVRERGRRRDNR